MRFWHISNKGFILYQSLLFFMFSIQFFISISTIAIHIRSENNMMPRMESFSFLEAATLDRIYSDLKGMDYGGFELEYANISVSVNYVGQTALLTFSKDVQVQMMLEFDDLVPCFTSYSEVRK
jgi:hypothetical protein